MLGLGHTTIAMTANHCDHGHDNKCTQSHYRRWTPCCHGNVLGDYRFNLLLVFANYQGFRQCTVHCISRHESFFRSQQADRRPFFTQTTTLPAGFPHDHQFFSISVELLDHFMFDTWLSWGSNMQILALSQS